MKGIVDNNLYINYEGDHLLILVAYVDDIIFGSDMEQLGHQLSKCMQTEFEIFVIGELCFFLGLKISQFPQGVFISQSKYLKETLVVIGSYSAYKTNRRVDCSGLGGVFKRYYMPLIPKGENITGA